MAITREKTQVFTQPIGVVRADASDSSVGEAISRAATTMANLAFRDAAIDAEKAGQEAAGAPSRTDIVTIDPATGRPVAYQPPSNFGRIAARSYQNMIDRRFEESINAELEERGREIANDSSSANDYRDRMSSYVQEMYANAVDGSGQLNNYGRYIEDTATSYIASTYATMREREARAAREALVRQQLVESHFGRRRINELMVSGASETETAAAIESEQARLDDIFQTGNMTPAEYFRGRNELDGYRSQIADNRLSNIYANIDDADRAALITSIRNPNAIPELAQRLGIPNLADIILTARIDGNDESLIAMMESQGRLQDEYTESSVNQYARSIEVSSADSVDSIRAKALQVPVEFRQEVLNELLGQWASEQINLEVVDEGDIDLLVNELRRRGTTDFTAVREVAGQEVAFVIANMTQDERFGLAEQLSNRRAALNAISGDIRLQTENNLRAEIRVARSNGETLERAADLRQSIESSSLDETPKATLLGLLDEAIVFENIQDAQLIGDISATRMAQIRSAVRSGQQVPESFISNLNENERAVFEAYREAYTLRPSQADSEMGRRLTALEDEAEQRVNNLQADLDAEAIEKNQGVDDALLQRYDARITEGLVINSASQVLNMTNADGINPFLDVANKGYVLPTLARVIESGLRSRNEDDMAAALQLFEVYSSLEVEVEGGRAQPMDILRRHLSEETYAMYSAISFHARDEGRAPLDIMLELQSFDENPDALIRADLGLAQNASLTTLFAEYPMSSNYREEILAMMRIRRIRGTQFTEDTVEQIINEYTDKQGQMRRDDAVIGPHIDEQTVYARTNYFTVGQIIENKNQLIDTMAEDPNYRSLLQGGTALDQTIRGVFGLLGADIEQRFFAAVESISPQMFGFDSIEEMNDRDRLNAGLQVLGIDLKYQPVMESFRDGGLATYRLGYELNGSFQPFMINGEPYLLQQTPESSRNFEIQQKLHNLRMAERGGNQQEIRRANFEYALTMEHLTPEMLLDRYPEFAEEINNAD